jgi:hypothetical protein
MTGSGRPTIHHSTFSALVQADEDLVGHVAYALYKRDKLKFCDAVRSTSSRDPTEAEVSAFILSCNLDTVLQGYRSQAEILLERMTEYQLEDAIGEVKRLADEDLLRQLKEGKSWKRSISESVIGSFVVAIVWAAIVLAIYASQIGPAELAKRILDGSVEPPAQKE